MNHKERFLATVERVKVDRPASWLGLPTTGAAKGFFRYFGVETIDELKKVLDDDIYPVEVPYHNPPSNHITCAFNFARAIDCGGHENRTLTRPGFFMNISDPGAVEEFNWPDPSEHMSTAECRECITKAPPGTAVLGIMWSAHFQDACAAFGMETALVKMLTEPEMFRAVINKITGFYLKANEIFYEAGKGKLDAVLIGNDFASQTGLMLSPELLRNFVFPGTRLIIEQAKAYGLKVMHHSCGAISEIIDDLIGMGADVIHPIQSLASGMAPRRLKTLFGARVSFCGGIDTQNLLVKGTAGDVKNKVKQLAEIFPTGCIISPSHEAILPDVPPANIAAMFIMMSGNYKYRK